ncbi:MAG: hypothetical protein DWQ11_12265 [Proteobacteria bacterium]|nr:MAG: hypothetical protein DWQ11_12265 [Pseudomonadota bacterium]
MVFHERGQEVQCAVFPSIAPQASVGADLSGGVFQKRNTVTVDVNGVLYEVGRDAKLAQDASYGRVLDSKFSLSDVYMALVRGAISYMGVPHIDVLVLGLAHSSDREAPPVIAPKIRRAHHSGCRRFCYATAQGVLGNSAW